MSLRWGGRGPWFLTRYVRTPTYNAAAQAFFDAMTVQPTPARKQIINALVVGLQFDGIWDKLDWLSLFAAHDAQAARLNAVNPAQGFSVVNSPTFTADRSYSGNGTTSYLDSDWDPVNNGVNFLLNSAHQGLFLYGALVSVGNPVGNGPSRVRNVSATLASLANSDVVTSAAVSAGGMMVWDRSASNAGKQFHNGVELNSFTAASTALASDDFFAGGYNNAGTPVLSAATMAAVCWGAHLTDAEHLALYTRLNTYMQAVGAA